ncbi:Uridine kinase [Mycobacteroides abscessus subsp. bolletii]|uniref:uridine kinase n=1 Tax=Rothia sp. P100 TaxID=2939578 RepID=UPI0009D53CAD|nr:uridine kinase [Rothia sp. P100]MCM3509479.1 uridine kinase [Rothia sp. P100]SLE45924.1 Uridine kinase [Mycobacteroides abscessus subsp. bolletii]
MKPLIIGIAGGTGSGKTTLTNSLLKRFNGQVGVIYHDNYYKRNDHLTYDERTELNYDAPTAFDNDLLVTHLKALIGGQTIETPVYDFTDHNRSEETMIVQPQRIIILEGILIFVEEEIRKLCDIKIFVDTDADVRILRRLRRDVIERGRSIESVESQYLATVKPMHELHVEPSKRHADMIIPEGANLVALDMLFHRVNGQIHGWADK